MTKVNIQVKDAAGVKGVVELLKATGVTDVVVNGQAVSATVDERLLNHLKNNVAVTSLSLTKAAPVPPIPLPTVPASNVVVVPESEENVS